MRFSIFFPADEPDISEYARRYFAEGKMLVHGDLLPVLPHNGSSERTELISDVIGRAIVQPPAYLTTSDVKNEVVRKIVSALIEPLKIFMQKKFPLIQGELLTSETLGVLKHDFADCGPGTVIYERKTSLGVVMILYRILKVDPERGTPSIAANTDKGQSPQGAVIGFAVPDATSGLSAAIDVREFDTKYYPLRNLHPVLPDCNSASPEAADDSFDYARVISAVANFAMMALPAAGPWGMVTGGVIAALQSFFSGGEKVNTFQIIRDAMSDALKDERFGEVSTLIASDYQSFIVKMKEHPIDLLNPPPPTKDYSTFINELENEIRSGSRLLYCLNEIIRINGGSPSSDYTDIQGEKRPPYTDSAKYSALALGLARFAPAFTSYIYLYQYYIDATLADGDIETCLDVLNEGNINYCRYINYAVSVMNSLTAGMNDRINAVSDVQKDSRFFSAPASSMGIVPPPSVDHGYSFSDTDPSVESSTWPVWYQNKNTVFYVVDKPGDGCCADSIPQPDVAQKERANYIAKITTGQQQAYAFTKSTSLVGIINSWIEIYKNNVDIYRKYYDMWNG